MSEAKIELKIGEIQFSGEGEQEWVAKQLEKILSKAEELIKLAPPSPPKRSEGGGHKPMGTDKTIASKPLGTFLREQNATTNQVKKFLVTAVWLESKGRNRMTTADVTGSLRDNSQTRLGNPSQCLIENVSKGFIEKAGKKEFFVTQEGKESL